MKKKFMYICLMTGLFSSGILVNNLNASDTNSTENITQDQTEDELSQELKNKLSPIKEKLQDKNLQDLYYSYKNCKDTQEYYKKIEDYFNNTLKILVNTEISKGITIGEFLYYNFIPDAKLLLTVRNIKKYFFDPKEQDKNICKFRKPRAYPEGSLLFDIVIETKDSNTEQNLKVYFKTNDKEEWEISKIYSSATQDNTKYDTGYKTTNSVNVLLDIPQERVNELTNALAPIKETFTDKNLQDLYYSYKNCKDMQEYYKKIEAFADQNITPFLNSEINDRKTIGDIVYHFHTLSTEGKEALKNIIINVLGDIVIIPVYHNMISVKIPLNKKDSQSNNVLSIIFTKDETQKWQIHAIGFQKLKPFKKLAGYNKDYYFITNTEKFLDLNAARRKKIDLRINESNKKIQQAEKNLSQELKNKLDPIREKFQDKNLREVYYSYKNCKNMQEYYKKIEDYFNETSAAFLNTKIINGKTAGEMYGNRKNLPESEQQCLRDSLVYIISKDRFKRGNILKTISCGGGKEIISVISLDIEDDIIGNMFMIYFKKNWINKWKFYDILISNHDPFEDLPGHDKGYFQTKENSFFSLFEKIFSYFKNLLTTL